MGQERSPGKPTTRRYSEAERERAVRGSGSCARNWERITAHRPGGEAVEILALKDLRLCSEKPFVLIMRCNGGRK